LEVIWNVFWMSLVYRVCDCWALHVMGLLCSVLVSGCTGTMVSAVLTDFTCAYDANAAGR